MASIDPTQTYATFSPTALFTYAFVYIQVDAIDVNSNHMTATRTSFDIHFTGQPTGASIDTNNPVVTGPGVYNGSWKANKAGSYTFSNKITADPGYDGNAGALPQNIQGSPFTKVLRGVCPQDMGLSLPLVYPASSASGALVSFPWFHDADGGVDSPYTCSPANNTVYPLGLTHVSCSLPTDPSWCQFDFLVQGCATLIVTLKHNGNPVASAPLSLVTFDCGHVHPTSYEMLANCPVMGSGVTGSDGVVSLAALPGKYLVIYQTGFESVDTRATPNIQSCETRTLTFNV